MRILYPSLPYELRTPDPLWEPEYAWAQAAGLTIGLFDLETARVWPPASNMAALYRGWMLTPSEYEILRGTSALLINQEQYLFSHLASGWYEAIKEYTFTSSFLPSSAAPDFSNRQRYFVKGLVKSFGVDSVVTSVAEWQALVQKYRVPNQELLFVRHFEDLVPNSERRYFVVAGTAYGAGGALLPSQLEPALFCLRSRLFYSLDVAITAAGDPIVVEVGDGQVSDLKEWGVAEFGRTVLRAIATLTQP